MQDGKKADYVIRTCPQPDSSHKVALIIELKGRHVEEAYKQITATLNREKARLLRGYLVLARIVPTQVPKAALKVHARGELVRLLAQHNRAIIGSKSAESEQLKLSKTGSKESLHSFYEQFFDNDEKSHSRA